MKLTRLSLAAIVAVGALGSFASATPLEEAIKGVDVSGFARLRYQSNDVEDATNTAESIRVSGELNLVAPVADGLSFGATLATDGFNFPGDVASAPTGDLGIVTTTALFGADSSGSFYFDKYYLLFTGVQDLAVIAGKYTVPAPWAESGFNGDRGNGVVALYSGVKDWTFAGALYLQTNGFLDTNILTDDLDSDGVVGDLGKRNLYALGAIGKAGPVDLQFWAASLEKIIDYTVYANAAFALNGFNVQAQVNYLKLGDFFGPANEDGIFYGIEGGYKASNWFATAGYTQVDKDQPIYALDVDNDGFIKFGQQLYTITTNHTDATTIFVKGGATFGQFGVEAGYGFADDGSAEPSELYLLANYQYAKNFGVELYYSSLDDDNANNVEANDEIRLQLLYTF
jgi:hypothetical protein